MIENLRCKVCADATSTDPNRVDVLCEDCRYLLYPPVKE